MITNVLKGFFLVLFVSQCMVNGAESLPVDLVDVGINESIGNRLPLDALFTDTRGQEKPLSDFLDSKKPTVLNLVYLNCPMLCHLILDGVSTTFQKMKPADWRQFNVLSVSFDPSDTVEKAVEFQKKYQAPFDGKVSWQFAVGQSAAIKQLTDAVGFRYKYNAKTKEFSHGSVAIIIDSDGTIMRYFYGIEYDPFDLRLALLESQPQPKRSVMESVLLFCYNYDSEANSYVLQAKKLMKMAGLLMMVSLTGLIVYLVRSTK